MPERHEMRFTVTGSNASEVEAAAVQRVWDYAGRSPARLTIDATPVMRSGAGDVLLWEGDVLVELGPEPQ